MKIKNVVFYVVIAFLALVVAAFMKPTATQAAVKAGMRFSQMIKAALQNVTSSPGIKGNGGNKGNGKGGKKQSDDFQVSGNVGGGGGAVVGVREAAVENYDLRIGDRLAPAPYDENGQQYDGSASSTLNGTPQKSQIPAPGVLPLPTNTNSGGSSTGTQSSTNTNSGGSSTGTQTTTGSSGNGYSYPSGSTGTSSNQSAAAPAGQPGTPIPQPTVIPASMALFGSGLVGLMLMRVKSSRPA